MWPYALSVFFGAFLLFQVQPLIGKYILPWFGGSPGVWTTCLLFFQCVLLAGYAYAHFLSTRFTRRQQAWVHTALLLASLTLLPIIPSADWKPIGAQEPISRILLLLGVTIGLPYFVLSATGPLLQQWFSQSHPGRSPYRLYALSNAGSLLALLSYPFVFEPFLTRRAQAWGWSAGLLLFAGLCAACAWRGWRTPAGSHTSSSAPTPLSPLPARADRVLWVVLPALASLLLLSTSNQISQDIAAMPFLWVVPLGIYLLTFILCFDHPRWYQPGLFSALFVLSGFIVCHLLVKEAAAEMSLQLTGYLGLLFSGCMICHGELYRIKPAPDRLTAYYLWIAAGGALGGFLVAVVAPLVFDRTAELQIGLWTLTYTLGMICLRTRNPALVLGAATALLLGAFLLPGLDVSPTLQIGVWARDYWTAFQEFYILNRHWRVLAVALAIVCFVFGAAFRERKLQWSPRLGAFYMILCVGLGFVLMKQLHDSAGHTLAATRNFYGTLRVHDEMADLPHGHHHKLVHGVITHGLQFQHEGQSAWPTTYYGESSGVGLAIKHLSRSKGERHLGLVGLGTGTLAAYGGAGDRIRIYEINPDVERIARTQFRYLEESFAKVEVVLGDARLSMEHELEGQRPQGFDLLALDAFSSDAIPTHLLSREAFATYLAHLRPDGILAVHISNRYLDLQPVVEKLAQAFGLTALTLSDDDPENWWIYRTKWTLLARDPALLGHEDFALIRREPSVLTEKLRLWTDDYSSVLSILR